MKISLLQLLARQLAGLLAASVLSGCAGGMAQKSAGNSEALVQQLVSEDAHVRIDELRVRGQTQRLTVHSKAAGVRDYDILLPGAGQDLSSKRDAAGQRVWSVLSF